MDVQHLISSISLTQKKLQSTIMDVQHLFSSIFLTQKKHQSTIMDVPLLETLKKAITTYTGLSPKTFVTVGALALAGYYVVRSFEEEESLPLPPPFQLGEISEELRAYDGNDSNNPLLMAIKGQIYDVSQSRMFSRPDGPYELFAGKETSRALAEMYFEDKDLNGVLTGLGVFEPEALQDWVNKFMSKYDKVGTIKNPEPQQRFRDVPVGGVPTDPFQSRVGTYLDNLRGGVNYHNQSMDVLFSHFHIERPPTMPPHYPYIPTWEELWGAGQHDGAGPSGTGGDGDDEW